jgi:hypothetical protein
MSGTPDGKRGEMRDVIYLGSAPSEEDCVQVGRPDYPEASKAECLAYIKAIKRVCGEPPEGAVLRVKAESHDYGIYRECVIEYDGNDQAAAEYAQKCDEKAPRTWAEADMIAPATRRRDR